VWLIWKVKGIKILTRKIHFNLNEGSKLLSIRISQILTSREEDSQEAMKELEKNISFSTVVENFSVCPSKKNEGDLGWGYENNLPFPLGEKITLESRGKIFGPIPTKFGYHIVKITEIREEETSMKTFAKDMPMLELVEAFPDANSLLFNKFSVIKPPQGYAPSDTLDSVCLSHGKPVEEVTEFLNAEYAKKRRVITPEDLNDKINEQSERLVLLDIREQWECDIAKIDSALHITSENSQEVVSNIAKGKEVVLIDWKEERAPSFQKWMMGFGFINVKTLEGGIDAWVEKVNPKLSRYTLDSDDGYRYEDIIDENKN